MNESFSPDGALNWLADILLLPGDAVVYLLVTYAPPIARLLDLATGERGVLAVTAAVVIWFAAIVLAGTVLSRVREIDRTLTARLAAAFAETGRLTRIARRRIIATLSLRSLQRNSSDTSLVVENVELAKIETSVLRCLSALDDGTVMTTEELSARLSRPDREIRAVLRRLAELDLIRPSTDSFAGKDGHCIATAGQMYLLGA